MKEIQRSDREILRELLESADAVGRFADDEPGFRAAYEAFQREDSEAFREVLGRFDLLPWCVRVCDWIQVKECVFWCTEVCGPTAPVERAPSERPLAEAIAKIASDEARLRELAAALERRDPAAFRRILDAYELGPLCHFFCHWICVLRARLVCRWLCGGAAERPDLIGEIRMAGGALRDLLNHPKAFDEAAKAARAGDPDTLARVIRASDPWSRCYLICLFFCSWRCVWACFTVCREFPQPVVRDPIGEAFEFASATRELAHNPAPLADLEVAVASGDAKAFGALVDRLKLQRFCHQICMWICFLRCRRFCRLVCPTPYDHPWFTHVGDFGIYSDIDPITGLTNKAQAGHGGPSFGFFNCLSLRGLCPKRDPANPSERMAYRFLFQAPGIPATPITGGFVCEVLVGSRYTLWNGNPNALQSVRIRGAGATSPTPPPPGPGLTPPDHFIVPDPQGWVDVDERALDNAFSGALMGFASAVAFPGGSPAPGVPAGTAVPAGNQRNGTDVAIIFQATRISTKAAVNMGAAPDYSNQLSKARINNWGQVDLLDLLQFTAPGSGPCSPLTNSLDILYTTDHELLAGWSIDMVTSANVVPAPAFPSGVGPRGAFGTDSHNIAAWPSCSYMIRLHTRRSLTDGLVDDPGTWVFKTFCIGARRP